MHGDDIMERMKGEITDLIDQASNGQMAIDAVKKAHKDR